MDLLRNIINDIDEYKNIIFDLDGVVFDTNKIKHDNIRTVIDKHCDQQRTQEVVDYFTSNNGIPREIKINKFFEAETAQQIISEYNELNSKTLKNSEFTKGFLNFLLYLESFPVNIYILSGGDTPEIVDLLKKKEILSEFTLVMGGPNTKYENLRNNKIGANTLFIGDSKVDYEVANTFDFDFIFMYGYSQFLSWETYFKDKNQVLVVEDFCMLKKII